MGMFDFPFADHWAWLILACALATAEMLVPGVFLIWLGSAAFLTGIITIMFGIGDAAQFMLFGASSIAAIYTGRRWFISKPIVSDDPLLNNRGARMVGEIVIVAQAIEGGSGRIKVGDSIWSAKGADAAVGARVRIARMDGGIAIVETV